MPLFQASVDVLEVGPPLGVALPALGHDLRDRRVAVQRDGQPVAADHLQRIDKTRQWPDSGLWVSHES